MKQLLKYTLVLSSEQVLKQLAILLSFVICTISNVGAQNATWVGTTSDFNTASNWSPSGVPSGGNMYTFDNTGITTTVTGNPAAGVLIVVNSSIGVRDYTISGVLSGATTITKNGSSKLTLTGTNTYSGITNVNAGILNIQNNAALGNTSNGTNVASGAKLQLQNNITVTGEALTLNGGSFVSATGGAITTSGDYIIHTFTSNGTFLANSGGTVEYLVIGGGGGGGGGFSSGNWSGGGGGGAGGYRSSLAGESSGGGSIAESALTLGVGSHSIVVGGGGSGGSVTNNGTNGFDSYIQNPSSVDLVRSAGGGGGAGARSFIRRDGLAGGSGGAAAGGQGTGGIGGLGTTSQGYNGGLNGINRGSGGGGGAGGTGINSAGAGFDGYNNYAKNHGGTGGPGVFSAITGVSIQRGGGGGGGCDETNNYLPGIGGLGGGGTGGNPTGTAGSPGTANTGGGGGGGTQSAGGSGGSGVVILRYLNSGTLENVSGDNYWTGTVTLLADNIITSTTGTLTVSGVISGAFALTKKGGGKLTLSGANTYSGLTNINAGILNIQNNAALGNTSNGTNVASGAKLQLQNNITVTGEALTLNGGSFESATGGAITTSGDYIIHTFTSSGTFSVISGGTVEYLVVGGGGGGGGSTGACSYMAGGGGAGGLLAGNTTVSAMSYAITVGGGGAGGVGFANGANGGNSIFSSITAAGGGGGGGGNCGNGNAGNAGGSGGGGNSLMYNPGMMDGAGGVGNTPSTTPSQGYNGGKGKNAGPNYPGGGGGGAGGVGSNATGSIAGVGGAGISSSINGTALFYAGGGGGGIEVTSVGGIGGSGIGGTGGGSSANGTAGQTNRGGGGGGAGTIAGIAGNTGGTGGSGVVILRYLNSGALENVSGDNYWTGTVTLLADNIITTTSGTLTVSGVISGSYALTKNGPGTLTLSNANTYTGGTRLSAGTLNINNASALGTSAGTFTINSGTIDNTSGAAITTVNYPQLWNADFTFTGTNNLNLGVGAVTFSASRQVTTTANTLTIGGVINDNTKSLTKAGAGTLAFGAQAVTINTLTISAGSLISTSGNLSLSGDFINNGSFTHNSGRVSFVGAISTSVTGTANGTSTHTFYDVTLNKSGAATITIPVGMTTQISNSMTFTNGRVTQSGTLLFLNGSTATGMTNASYVNGQVNKVGAQAFTFPVGGASLFRPIIISAPSVATDLFTARYFPIDPSPTYTHTSILAPIDHISRAEYWILDRIGGSSNINVSLTWNSNSGAVTNLSDLLVARWDSGSLKWQSQGNGGTTGTTASGTVITSAPVTQFSPFTLASRTSANPLPIELVSFNCANIDRNTNELNWKTASESNNDYYAIERSADGLIFEEIGKQNGAGNSLVYIYYSYKDQNPSKGVSYYRLKQVDFNGKFTYSDICSVINNGDGGMVFYPNPVENILTIEYNSSDNPKSNVVSVTDVAGKLVQVNPSFVDSKIIIDCSDLPEGIYFLKVLVGGKVVFNKFTVQK